MHNKSFKTAGKNLPCSDAANCAAPFNSIVRQ